MVVRALIVIIWEWAKNMKMFEAMVFKREIGANCGVDVTMIDTPNDGLVLSIEEDLVKSNNLLFIRDFVNQHKLFLLLDSERYFISTSVLEASTQIGWDS